MRESGILLPISSLPSRYGIGTFSKEAYEFVNKLKTAGQKYWQILPLGATSYGDSPYQSFSTYAGNPYFIDLETLMEQGYITKEDCDACDFGDNERYIDYGKLYESRFLILKKAFEASNIVENEDYKKYVKKNSFWLNDYALFMAIKNDKGGVSWSEWEEEIRLRTSHALKAYHTKLEQEVEFYQYLQFEFSRQWKKLKKYANKAGIKIIGDIPIYVAFDSADCWANTKLFQFDEENKPIGVAGCPPDAFSETGQLWGNPLYDWDYHEETDYAWWIQRIKYCFKLYDKVRVDHFRGFDEYYSIPYGAPTAVNGKWMKGPGNKLFKALNKELGDLDIIAEDLGFLTDSVRKLLKKTGYPGMKVLQFAFDSREESDYLPHNYDKNCVVYTGTHDNNTLIGWFDELSKEDREFARQYLNKSLAKRTDIPWSFVRLAMSSVAELCIIPMQEFIAIGKEGRINTPSTLGDNWKWRMEKDDITEEIVNKIRKITKLYGRLPVES